MPQAVLRVQPQVLRSDGHVCVVNSNPAFEPLMRHAAARCTNTNVWWHWAPYTPGTLLTRPAALMCASAQPARRAAAGQQRLSNPHCPRPALIDQPLPTLATIDKWRLWGFHPGRISPTHSECIGGWGRIVVLAEYTLVWLVTG